MKKDVRAKQASDRGGRKKSSDLSPKIEPQPGAICAVMIRCGRPNCRCSRDLKHGPYFFRYWYENGKRCKKYIKKGEVQAAFDAYSAYKQQQKHWRELIRSINESGNTILRAMREALRSMNYE